MKRPDGTVLTPGAFAELAGRLGALYSEEDQAILLAMLGQEYLVTKTGITLRGQKAPESHGMVILDYLTCAGNSFTETPWRAYGDLTGEGGTEFRMNVDAPLAQHVGEFLPRAGQLLPLFDGTLCPSMIGSDAAFTVRALPKVSLRVEMLRENQEFPADAWVLFSNNADDFLSAQGLMLLGELFKDRFLSLLRIY